MVTKFAAAVAFAAGALLLIGAVAIAALNVYYRPTIEYAYTDGAAGTLPNWVTPNLITGIVAALLSGSGCVFLYIGKRCRRRLRSA
jgi:hypothetical protein